MPKHARSVPSAIGFRVKSGWATAVLLAGPIESPQVLARRPIDLCDPAIPESRQPHHAAMGKLETDEAKVQRRRKVIVEAANQSVKEILHHYSAAGHEVRAAGLVVGSQIDPAKITNPHIRAHALEGQLFRTVLEDALRSGGLSCSVISERDVYTRASEVLKRPEDELKQLVAKLGRSVDGPWRSDEKCATLAAWLALT